MRLHEKMYKFIVFIVSFSAILMVTCGKQQAKINLIYLNSLQGLIFPIEKEIASEKVMVGGFSLISQKIKEIKQSVKDEPVILVANSNFIYGSAESYFTDGEAVIDLMNALRFDAFVIGHQDFYFGRETLINLSKKAQFPFIASNLVKTDGSVPDFIKPYHVTKAGLGIIGLVTPKMIRQNVDEIYTGLKLLPVNEALENYVEQLNQKGVEHIAVFTDLPYGGDSDSKDFQLLKTILDVAGVEHVFVRARDNDSQGEFAAGDVSKTGKKIFALATRGESLGFYRFDPNSKKGEFQIFQINSSELEPDPDKREIVSGLRKNISELEKEKLAVADSGITNSFFEESKIGNLTTDIFREFAQTDVFVVNSGMFYGDGFNKGPITKRNIINSIPFRGNLVVANMIGAQILRILEKSCSFTREARDTVGKGFLQVSGIAFEYDSTAKIGSRIVEGSVLIDKQPLDRSRLYTFGMIRWIFEGGDGYSEFKEMGIEPLIIHSKPYRNILEDYFKRKGVMTSKIEQRIVDISLK